MTKFLRENWKWIVFPILLVAVALLAFVMISGEENASPFKYRDF